MEENAILRAFASKQLQSFHYSKKYVLKNLFLCYLHYSTFLLKDDVSARIITKGTNKDHKILSQILGSE